MLHDFGFKIWSAIEKKSVIIIMIISNSNPIKIAAKSNLRDIRNQLKTQIKSILLIVNK